MSSKEYPLKLMDLDVLLEEINKYKQVSDCRHCDLYQRCKSADNPSYCKTLLAQVCNYLEDGDDLKRTIRGCVFGKGKWNCNNECMFFNKAGRCIFQMLSKAYDKLNVWTIN